jgi:hypothetical protein
MRQPTLFDRPNPQYPVSSEQVVLFALGDFQARGKTLAERELALDRLRGALKRASEYLGLDELDDAKAVAAFTSLGAKVRKVPPFVAKHPFRITVPKGLAESARAVYADRVGLKSVEPRSGDE